MFKIALVSGFIATLVRAYILYGFKKKVLWQAFENQGTLNENSEELNEKLSENWRLSCGWCDRSYGNYLYDIYIQFIRERNRLQENHQLYVNYNFFVIQSSSLPLRNSHTSWSLVFISKDIYLQHPCEPKNNIYNNRTLTEQYLI